MFRNKLLGWAFAASIVINITFLVLVGNSDIFQHADVLRDLRAQEIKVYKPPIPQKPRPKPKPRIKPPPKPKPPHPKQVVKPRIPPPPPQPKPVVRRAAPPPRVKVAVSTGSHVTSGNGPAMPANPEGEVGQPTESVTTPPPTPPPPKPTPPPPTPAPAPPPKPQPAPAPPPPAPKPAIPDRASPVPDTGNWPDLSIPGDVDLSTVTNSALIVSFEVDENGHPKHIRVKRSCGNDDIDTQAVQTIQGMRFKPAVQNGVPQEMDMEHEFDVGT